MFLDEKGGIAPYIQVELFRFYQEGGCKVRRDLSIKSNLRLVSSMNNNLAVL